MSNTGLKSVHRYDDEAKGHGFQVMVSWQGKLRHRKFSDAACDGPERALRAALRWRNKAERELGKPRSELWLRSSGTNAATGERWKR